MRNMTTMTIALAAALAGCALNVDPHALSACTIGTVNGQPVDGLCENACAGTDYDQTSQSGPTCSSSKLAAAFGVSATCHYITDADGTTGCCALVGHQIDPRIESGTSALDFFECDGGGK